MRVVIRNGEAEVELSHEGPYAVTIMRDLSDLARKTYKHAFDDLAEDDVEVTEDEQQ